MHSDLSSLSVDTRLTRGAACASTVSDSSWQLADISTCSTASACIPDPEENCAARQVSRNDVVNPLPGDACSGWRTAPPRRQVAPPRNGVAHHPGGVAHWIASARRGVADPPLVWYLYTHMPPSERDWWYHDDGFYCLPYVSGQEVPWVRPYHTSELRHQLEVELAHAKRLSRHVMTISHRWLRLVLYYTVRSVDLTRRNSRI